MEQLRDFFALTCSAAIGVLLKVSLAPPPTSSRPLDVYFFFGASHLQFGSFTIHDIIVFPETQFETRGFFVGLYDHSLPLVQTLRQLLQLATQALNLRHVLFLLVLQLLLQLNDKQIAVLTSFAFLSVHFKSHTASFSSQSEQVTQVNTASNDKFRSRVHAINQKCQKSFIVFPKLNRKQNSHFPPQRRVGGQQLGCTEHHGPELQLRLSTEYFCTLTFPAETADRSPGRVVFVPFDVVFCQREKAANCPFTAANACLRIICDIWSCGERILHYLTALRKT